MDKGLYAAREGGNVVKGLAGAGQGGSVAKCMHKKVWLAWHGSKGPIVVEQMAMKLQQKPLR